MKAPEKLPARYHAAFMAVAADLIADKEVRGATLSGSMLRGEEGPTSDLDINVIVSGKHRQRRQFMVDGVFVEMFRNPLKQVERYFKENDHIAMHMLGYGHVIVDKDGALAKVRKRARALFKAGPPAMKPDTQIYARYSLWDICADVRDLLAARQMLEARALMGKVVWDALAFHYARHRRWEFKPKRMLGDLRSWQPKLARLVEAFFATQGPAATAPFEAAIAIILAPQKLHEPMIWETKPQKVVD